jgi:hypothetical protein
MDGMSGTELIVLARQVHRGLPVIVMTAHPNADLRSQALQGSIEYFDKPIDFESFLACIDSVLDRRRVGFSGAISVQTLPDIVQLYALANTSGVLRIRRRSREGLIWFDHGEIVHASAAGMVGVDAFYEIMLWSGGEFSIDMSAEATSRSIWARWTELLMESCRILDERRREVASAGPTSRRGWNLAGGPSSTSGAPSGPPSSLEHPSSASPSELSPIPTRAHASSVPPKERAGASLFVSSPSAKPAADVDSDMSFDQMFADESTSVSAAPKVVSAALRVASPPAVAHGASAAAYQRGVDILSNLDGFIAAAVVDCLSGMVLCQKIGAAFDIEIAAAGDARLLDIERKALSRVKIGGDIEDLLITLTTRYHLVRPVRSNPENFFCLILDRRRVNLAIARRSLIDVESDV